MLSASQAMKVRYMGHLEQSIARDSAEDLLVSSNNRLQHPLVEL